MSERSHPAPAYEEQQESPVVDFYDRIQALSVLNPRLIERRLLALGYRGQKHARRAGAVMAYRHVRRLKRLFIEQVPMQQLPTRDNYLFIGPTGCGKTYLVELLFRHLLNVPTIITDITQFSETGYVGDDTNMVLSRLYEAAGQDVLWASCGVICLDEFDKIAASRSNARFAGAGTTKDVSGFGVQRSLLTLMSSDRMQFPMDFGYAHLGQKGTMPLSALTIIACGAFSGLKSELSALDDEAHIGFTRTPKRRFEESIAVELEDRLLEKTAVFARYGFLPELIGRFSRVVLFRPLEEATLHQILEDNVLAGYRREFADEGVELLIEEQVLDHIVRKAQMRETGARALRAAIVPYLEQAAYQTFGHEHPCTVTMQVRDGEIVIETDGAPSC